MEAISVEKFYFKHSNFTSSESFYSTKDTNGEDDMGTEMVSYLQERISARNYNSSDMMYPDLQNALWDEARLTFTTTYGSDLGLISESNYLIDLSTGSINNSLDDSRLTNNDFPIDLRLSDAAVTAQDREIIHSIDMATSTLYFKPAGGEELSTQILNSRKAKNNNSSSSKQQQQ